MFLVFDRFVYGAPFTLGQGVRSLPYWLPDKYTLALLVVSGMIILFRKISLNRINSGILLVAFSNLGLYYLSALHVYYYLVPSTVFLCIFLSAPLSNFIHEILEKQFLLASSKA